MTTSERIETLKDTKQNFIRHIQQISNYHEIDQEKLYNAISGIEGVFDYMVNFYEKDIVGDNTAKKGLALEVIEAYSSKKLPSASMIHFIGESSIEYLFYLAVNQSIPELFKGEVYLLPQVLVCKDKYRLDFALIHNRTQKILIGIECDGHTDNHITKSDIENDYYRERQIKKEEHVEIWRFAGTEIYRDFTGVAREFWEYIEENYSNEIIGVPEDYWNEIEKAMDADYTSNSHVCNFVFQGDNGVLESVSSLLDKPELIRRYHVFEYQFLDNLGFMYNAKDILGFHNNYNKLIYEIRNHFLRAGWEGDGVIQLLWFPPFLQIGIEDTWGTVVWHVKQKNNGTSFIASPEIIPNLEQIL